MLWNHPSGKLYPPAKFIALAENSGLIVELGYWIAEEACNFQSRLINDFSTGYSSFSYLHRFPFDTLKTDRVFVNAMVRSLKSKQIVKSLVHLSHDLGMDVIAEGIETEQEADLMRGYKADLGQGYFYSKPVNETDYLAY